MEHLVKGLLRIADAHRVHQNGGSIEFKNILDARSVKTLKKILMKLEAQSGEST
jgi:hypothetical protein